MTTTIERAESADADALLQAQVRAFHNDAVIYPGVGIGGPPGYDSLASVLEKIQQDDTFKIVYQSQIVGGIVVFDEGDGHYHLDLIFIDPDYHNLGIGSEAMRFLDQRYAARKWTLDTPLYSVRNHHFYEKFGFIKVGEKKLDGEDIILIAYEKEIGNPDR